MHSQAEAWERVKCFRELASEAALFDVFENESIPIHVTTSRPQRVLMLTHRYPYPPHSGDRIRSYNLLRFLADHYRVSLGCTTDEPVSDEQLAHLDEMCEQVHTAPLGGTARKARAATAFARGKSLTEGMFANGVLARSIAADHQADPYDVVLVFCSSMFPYVDNSIFRDTRIIVDLVDVDSQKWQQLSRESTFIKRPLYALEAKRVRKLEQRIADQADAIALVSEKEADLYRHTVQTNDTPITGISNGVDTDYFHPISQPSTLDTQASTLNLVFTGVLDYPPNVEGIDWFCRHVLPDLNTPPIPHSTSARLRVCVAIVGRNPNARIQSLASIDGVTVVGEVPDVRPYLHQSDIAISPLKLARGIQNKVLEAMACELPVIVTTPSAEGIDAISGQHFIIADTVEQWQQAITKLADDPNARATMGHAARDLVVADYSWPARLSKFRSLIAKE